MMDIGSAVYEPEPNLVRNGLKMKIFKNVRVLHGKSLKFK